LIAMLENVDGSTISTTPNITSMVMAHTSQATKAVFHQVNSIGNKRAGKSARPGPILDFKHGDKVIASIERWSHLWPTLSLRTASSSSPVAPNGVLACDNWPW
jgi:hypothetical protein